MEDNCRDDSRQFFSFYGKDAAMLGMGYKVILVGGLNEPDLELSFR